MAITEVKTQVRESGAFFRRIGNTVYRVHVYFADTNTETAQDKIARLIRMEAQNGKVVNL